MGAIDKLQAYNSNFEESKKAMTQTREHGEGRHVSGSRKSAHSAETKSKLKELYNSICQCGKPAPKFK